MRKFLAGLFAFLFIVGFAANTIGLALMETLFSPKTYMAAIRSPEFAEAGANLMRGEVTAQLGAQGGVGAFLSGEEVNSAAEQLVTGPWLSAQMERWLETLAVWMEGDEPAPKLTLSLTELKQQVPPLVESLLTGKLKALPVCDSGFLLKALEAILSGNSIPLCLPSQFDIAGFLGSGEVNLQGTVEKYLASVPDEIDVLTLLSSGARERTLSTLTAVRRLRQQAAAALTILGAILLALFLLIGLLRHKPWRALFQWWGWTMLLAGGLALSAFGLVYALRGAIWTWIMTSPSGALPAALSQMAETLVMAILAPVWSRVLLLGGVAAGVGLFLVLLAFALPRAKAQPS